MATSAEASVNLGASPENNNNLQQQMTAESLPSADKATHRGYWKIIRKKNKEGVEVEHLDIVAKSEIANQANWKKLEAKGYQLLNENSFTRYTVKSEAAFASLIPEASQRVYLAQSGINYSQNSKQNGFATELKDGTGVLGPDGHIIPPVAVHNNEEIDLRSSLNEPPGRRILTPQERMIKEFQKYGMSPEALKQMLADAYAAYAATANAGSASANDEESDEDEEEEEEVPA